MSDHDDQTPEAPRPVPVRRRGAEDAPPSEPFDLPTPEESLEAATEGSVPPEWLGGEPAPPSAPDVIERPLHELGVAVLATAIAVLTFFPWYSSTGVSASGWASGGWGPVVFGLSLAAIAIVVLRRVGVAIRFPVHHALVLEVIGWTTVGLLLLKRFFVPSIAFGKLGVTIWLTVTLFVALALALLGGSVSQGVTMVVRPGWFGDTAGKLGVGVLAVALIAGGAFGFLNDAAPGFGGGSAGPDGVAPQFESGYPECASDAGVPVPDKIEPVSGTSQASGFCIASMQTKLGRNKVLGTYASTLKQNGWKITYDSRKAGKDVPQAQVVGQLQATKGASCASFTVSPPASDGDLVRVTMVIGPPDQLCNLGEKINQLPNQP